MSKSLANKLFILTITSGVMFCLAHCGSKKSTNEGGSLFSDRRVPAGWDGVSDFVAGPLIVKNK